jgi:hypothetical protein
MRHSNLVNHVLRSMKRRKDDTMFATSHLQKNHGSEGGSIRSISLDDVEKLQAVYPDYRIELRDGKLIVMSPSDSASGERGAGRPAH